VVLPGTQCAAEADVIVTLHQIHACSSGDTDAFGNESGPVCGGCLESMTADVRAYVDRLRAVARRRGGVAACQTCGAPAMHVSDVIRDVRPLK